MQAAAAKVALRIYTIPSGKRFVGSYDKGRAIGLQ